MRSRRKATFRGIWGSGARYGSMDDAYVKCYNDRKLLIGEKRKMELLFGGNTVILLFWVYINFIIEVKEKYKKIILMYIITYIANVMDIVPTPQSYLILLFALFVELEFWEDRFKTQIIRNVFEKMLDFLFTMITQYALFSFTLSLVLSSKWFTDLFNEKLRVVALLMSGFFMYISCRNTASQKFKIYSFTEIKRRIDAIEKYRTFLQREKVINDAECILAIEDRSYFDRGEKYTFFNTYYLSSRHWKKIVNMLKKFFSSRNKKKSIKRFVRGYSTIEMQLLRTLAIEEGYSCIFRRKIFEILYAKLFWKNLKVYYKNCECDTSYFKDYLLFLYMQAAQCLNRGAEKKLVDVIGKKRKNILDYTKEELFVLTLCFSGKIKRDYVLEIYQEVMWMNNLDEERVNELVRKLNNR